MLEKLSSTLRSIDRTGWIVIGSALVVVVLIILAVILTSGDSGETREITTDEPSQTTPVYIPKNNSIGLRNGRWYGYFVNFAVPKNIRESAVQDDELNGYSENIYWEQPDEKGSVSVMVYPTTLYRDKDLIGGSAEKLGKGLVLTTENGKQIITSGVVSDHRYIAQMQIIETGNDSDSLKTINKFLKTFRSNPQGNNG